MPVEWEWTCSYECELMAVSECLRVVIEKQREGAALPDVVILTDCRALVQALGGSGSEGVGEAVLLADYLLKTEGVQTVVQWIPSHVKVLGNEIADRLANEGRSMPQPRKPLSLGPHWRQQLTCPTIHVLKYSLSLVPAHTKSVTCRSVGAILCVLQPGLTSVALLDRGEGGAIT
ncbi:transposon i factor [Plakobranchus ocellatus]|uniref:Transposon i factor n=1 Tax=Plakobranchus ocellatus TaxID=259542 RepID=A0AAV3Z4E9_9GAST|nr:transposon i factor [Plakobranchus ocellatus]